MAEYLVQGESITTVADAIREKGGTSEPLSFPEGMAAAVKGIQGNDLSLGITGATVDQTIKVKAVDTEGKPTAWKTVDAAGGGELTWHEVIDHETTEVVNDLRISTDKSGQPISGYHAIGMILIIGIPADSTQTSVGGDIWIYPITANNLASSLRYIQNVASWKTVSRYFDYFYAGNNRAMSLPNLSAIGFPESPNAVFDGIRLYVQKAGDHLPVGTKVRCLVLSKGWEA